MMEVTGTNWPMFNTICLLLRLWFLVANCCVLASVMQCLERHDTPVNPLGLGLVGCVFCSDCGLSVVVSGGVTPGPVPNPEAKPTCADGTAPGRVWESKSPPALKLND